MTDATATDQAKDKVQQAAGQAQEKAQQAAGQARSQIHQQVDQRSTEAGQRVNGTAGDLRSVADSLRQEGKDQPARFAEQAAERAEKLGGYLENNDADRLLADVEDYARRQPWIVGLGAAALGFAAARFLKASSDQRYQQRSGSPQRTLGNGTPTATTPRYAGTGTAGVPGYTAPATSTGTPPAPAQGGF
jgi:hypothetical protein